ncbi:MAG: hypothetical protein O2973_04565 [Gemmatimonadetes bacterium]|nr:hypothetical protein [Gemmatimonadota bacterium]
MTIRRGAGTRAVIRVVAAVVAVLTIEGAVATNARAQGSSGARRYTHADSLRGGNGPGRSWWDATFYDLHVAVSPTDSSIRGWNGITYRVLTESQVMQVDLQPPLVVDSIRQNGRNVTYTRDGNAAAAVGRRIHLAH